MMLHTDSDHIHLVTDPTLFVIGPEGRSQGIVPYRLGVPPMNMRRDAQGVMRPFQPGMQVLPPQMMALQNGNPLAVQQLKKMQPPTIPFQLFESYRCLNFWFFAPLVYRITSGKFQ